MKDRFVIKLEVDSSDLYLVMKAARRCVQAMVEHDLLSESGNTCCETEEYQRAFKRIDAIHKEALGKAK